MPKIIPVCPHCGCTRLQYHYSDTTAMGWIQIIENGEPISSNPNIETNYYTCCECHHNFHTKVQFNEIIDTIDDGETHSFPVIEMPPATMENSTIVASTYTLNLKLEDNPTQIKYQWEVDIEEIKKRLDKLEKQVYYSWE